MTAEDTFERVRSRRPRIAVVGDFLLDSWWRGHIDRIAREAPAPVVDLDERRDAPGGAANTAHNLAGFGAQVVAIGAVGDDADADRLRSLLAEEGVDVTRLRKTPGAVTTTKVRVSVDEQVLLRLDETRAIEPASAAREHLIADLAAVTDECDAVLVCDYGSAVWSRDTVEAIGALPRPSLLVVDAHEQTKWRDVHPDLVTPNAAEAEQCLRDDASAAAGADLRHGADEDRTARALSVASRVLERTGALAAVMTLDRAGTVAAHRDGTTHVTRARPAPEKQASGAGDVFVAALTAACSTGASLAEAADLAQCAADIAVLGEGTCRVTAQSLTRHLRGDGTHLREVNEIRRMLEKHRENGERIVFTNGCFDVLHRGHTSSLRQAKRLGDVLVVAINSDASARRVKGPGRPVNDVFDRSQLVAELACVDYVTVFDDDTACAVLRALRPDVYAKGGDYTPEMLAETRAVREFGGEIVMLDYVPEHSTSRLLGRIRSGDTGLRAEVP